MVLYRSRATGKYVPKSVKLLDQVKEVLRYHHYSIRTEHTYLNWIIKFIKFNNKVHPKDMGKIEIENFLSYLAVNLNVSKSTQDQAFNAILFLYDKVLLMPIKDQIQASRSTKNPKLPVVLSHLEVKKLFLKKIWELDPLACPKCNGEMSSLFVYAKHIELYKKNQKIKIHKT